MRFAAVIVVTALVFAFAPAAHAGLIGYWAFENNTNDSSPGKLPGNLHNGILVGDATYVPNSLLGGMCLDLGNNGYMRMETNPLSSTSPNTMSTNTPSYTIAAWVYRKGAGTPTSTGSGGINAEPIVAKLVGEADGSTTDGNYFLGIVQSPSRLGVDFEEHNQAHGGQSPGLNHPSTSTATIPDGVWTHVASTFNGRYWTLYINGSPVAATSTDTGRFNPPRYDSIQVGAIGVAINSTGGVSGHLNAMVDDVAIWDYPLTAAQIQALYNRSLTPLQIQSAPGATLLLDNFNSQTDSNTYGVTYSYGLNMELDRRQSGDMAATGYERNPNTQPENQQVNHPSYPGRMALWAQAGAQYANPYVVLGRSFPENIQVSVSLDPYADDTSSPYWMSLGLRGQNFNLGTSSRSAAAGVVFQIASNGNWEVWMNGAPTGISGSLAPANQYDVVATVFGDLYGVNVNGIDLDLNGVTPGILMELSGAAAGEINFVSIGAFKDQGGYAAFLADNLRVLYNIELVDLTIPEPASAALLACGLVAVAVRRRRR